MDDILEFLYDLLPPWLATVIAGGISLIAGIIGSVWHSHELAQLDLCNSASGQFAQVVNGAAHTSCGTSSLFSTIALLLEIAGYIGVAVFAVVFMVLAAKGKLMGLEAAPYAGASALTTAVNRGAANPRPGAVKCIAVPRHGGASLGDDHCVVCFSNAVPAMIASGSAVLTNSRSNSINTPPAAAGCIAVPRHAARSSAAGDACRTVICEFQAQTHPKHGPANQSNEG